ncbi:hypothetical protein U9M48_042609 [Paspalum notatum var. saurae]|uniref:Uncharacterized protein n=1 Tax=Paspalum notatum var. saurae TaxID=547442 RepID=A0AAQ3UXG7_PASNO
MAKRAWPPGHVGWSPDHPKCTFGALTMWKGLQTISVTTSLIMHANKHKLVKMHTKKFRNKSFPLFEALGELYDGQIAEGTINFTSTQPSQPPITQPSQPPFTQPSVTQLDPPIVQSDDDDLAILNPPATTSVSKRGKRARTHDGKVDKRRQDRRVAVSEMMGRFLEMKEKQAEAEAEERARTNTNENDFSLPMCIAVVDGIEDLSKDEKIDAFDIFKDAQNRAIFMTAKDATRVKWLRKKIGTHQSKQAQMEIA